MEFGALVPVLFWDNLLLFFPDKTFLRIYTETHLILTISLFQKIFHY